MSVHMVEGLKMKTVQVATFQFEEGSIRLIPEYIGLAILMNAIHF